MHLVWGLTQGSMSGDEWYPPMSDGLFELSKIEAIEKEDLDFTESDTSETTVDDQTGSDLAPDANLRETTDPCAVFREMEHLAADEVTIAFVGDRNDDGAGQTTCSRFLRAIPESALLSRLLNSSINEGVR